MLDPRTHHSEEDRHGSGYATRSRLDEAAGVLYALATSRYLARRFAGRPCHLCGHERARAVTGDHRITAGPRRGTCNLRCYARLVDVEYRVAALGLDGADDLRVHPATCRAVSRRLFTLVAEHEATGGTGPAGHGVYPERSPGRQEGGIYDDR